MTVIEAMTGPAEANNLGRDKLDWSPAVWERLDQHVAVETKRCRVATRFLPTVDGALSPSTRTVPADAFEADKTGTLLIPEGREIALEETSIPFTLTKQQYEAEERLGTALTLATRAANRLARAMDRSVFQTSGNGSLTQKAEEVGQIVEVPLLNRSAPGKYGEKSFEAVAAAYALLESQGHYGPYALVCRFEPYADAHAPLKSTLIMPADRIHSLMTAGFYGTGTLPEKRAVMVSTGGNMVDVAISVDAMTAFAQVDSAEVYRFRVYQRFTVRVKDPTALVLLTFE